MIPIQTKTKSPKSNLPERTTRQYQIPRYVVRKFAALWFVGALVTVVLGTELAMYLSPEITRPYALLLTLVCGTSALIGCLLYTSPSPRD